MFTIEVFLSIFPGKSPDALQAEMTQLESKLSQLTRANQVMEAELKTIRVQLDARDKALKVTFVMGLSPTWVMTMFLHMTPVLVGSKKRTQK
jgi:hypothetical protein